MNPKERDPEEMNSKERDPEEMNSKEIDAELEKIPAQLQKAMKLQDRNLIKKLMTRLQQLKRLQPKQDMKGDIPQNQQEQQDKNTAIDSQHVEDPQEQAVDTFSCGPSIRIGDGKPLKVLGDNKRTRRKFKTRGLVSADDGAFIVLVYDLSGSMKPLKRKLACLLRRQMDWLRAQKKQVLIVGFDHMLHWMLISPGDISHETISMGNYFTGQETKTLPAAQPAPAEAKFVSFAELSDADINRIIEVVTGLITKGGTFGAPALSKVLHWLNENELVTGRSVDIYFMTDGKDGGDNQNSTLRSRKYFLGRIKQALNQTSGRKIDIMPIGLGNSADLLLLRKLGGLSGVPSLHVKLIAFMAEELGTMMKAWGRRVGQDPQQTERVQRTRLKEMTDNPSEVSKEKVATLEQVCRVFAHEVTLPLLHQLALPSTAYAVDTGKIENTFRDGVDLLELVEATDAKNSKKRWMWEVSDDGFMLNLEKWRTEHPRMLARERSLPNSGNLAGECAPIRGYGVQLLKGCLALLTAHFQGVPPPSMNELQVLEFHGSSPACYIPGAGDSTTLFMIPPGKEGQEAALKEDTLAHDKQMRANGEDPTECFLLRKRAYIYCYPVSPDLDLNHCMTSAYGSIGKGLPLPVAQKIEDAAFVSLEAYDGCRADGINWNLQNVTFREDKSSIIGWSSTFEPGRNHLLCWHNGEMRVCQSKFDPDAAPPPADAVMIGGKTYHSKKIIEYWENLRNQSARRLVVATSTEKAILVCNPADPFEPNHPIWLSVLLQSSARRMMRFDGKDAGNMIWYLVCAAGDIDELLMQIVQMQMKNEEIRVGVLLALYRAVATFRQVAKTDRRVLLAVSRAQVHFMQKNGGRLRSQCSRPSLLAALIVLTRKGVGPEVEKALWMEMVRCKRQDLSLLLQEWIHLSKENLSRRVEELVAKPTFLLANLQALGTMEQYPSPEQVEAGNAHIRLPSQSIRDLLPFENKEMVVPLVLTLARYQRDKDRENSVGKEIRSTKAAIDVMETQLAQRDRYYNQAVDLFKPFSEHTEGKMEEEDEEEMKATYAELKKLPLSQLPWDKEQKQKQKTLFVHAWKNEDFRRFLLSKSALMYFDPPRSFFESAVFAVDPASPYLLKTTYAYMLVKRAAADWAAVLPFLQGVKWFDDYSEAVLQKRKQCFNEIYAVLQACKRPKPLQVMLLRDRWAKITGMGLQRDNDKQENAMHADAMAQVNPGDMVSSEQIASSKPRQQIGLVETDKTEEEEREHVLSKNPRGVLHHPSSSVPKAVLKAIRQFETISAKNKNKNKHDDAAHDDGATSGAHDDGSPSGTNLMRKQVRLLRSLMSYRQSLVLDVLVDGVPMEEVCSGYAGAYPPARTKKAAIAQLRWLRESDRGASLYLQFAFVKKGGKLGIRFVWADAVDEVLRLDQEGKKENKNGRVPRGYTFLGPMSGEERKAAAAAEAKAKAKNAKDEMSQPAYAPAALGRLVGVAAEGTRPGELSAREAQMIFQAMPEMAGGGYTRQGHWFCCPNGHIYTVGECGGAVVESQCPECGAIIGGGGHLLRNDNAVAEDFLQHAGQLHSGRANSSRRGHRRGGW